MGKKDYILRSKAIKVVTGWETDPTDKELEMALSNVPSADVVKVVRCGECVNWKADFPYNTCELFGGRWNENMFCWYGRRKNG